MKIKFLIVLFVFTFTNIFAQNIDGNWSGNLKINGSNLPIIISIKNSDGKYTSSFQSPKQSDKVFKFQETSYLNNQLILDDAKIGINISGKLVDEKLDCVFKQGSYEGSLILTKVTTEIPKPVKTTIADLGDSPINTKKIEAYLNYLTENHQAIGSVSIFRNGKEVYLKNFGQNQLENVKYDANTEYHIGSISKMFTATMLFQMIEKGKLKLTDQLSKFYPKIPNAEKITIKNLLNHTSGLGDYVGEDTVDNKILFKPATTQEIIDIIIKQGVTFQPGEETKYSNSGYFLLSRILEKISGENYNEILSKNIVEKLHLKNTHSLADRSQNIFKSYEENSGKWIPIEELEFKNAIGLGDITSTTTDLNIFINGLFEGKLVSKGTLKQMITIEKKSGFGMGIMRVPFYNQTAFGHGGDTLGTHSIVSYDDKNNYSIALITNGNRIGTNEIDIGISSILFNIKDFKFPLFLKLNESDLVQYEGTYSAPNFPMKITITKVGTDLKAQGTDQPSFPLTALGKDKFGFTPADFTITFSPEKKTATIVQSGETIVLTREN